MSAMMNNGASDVTTPSTSRYVHPGHDRIAREFHDLRQREDELRGRWKEMGFELPQVCSDNETPFTLPDPIPSDVTVAQRPNHIDLVSPQSRDTLNGSRETLDAMSVSSSEASLEAATAASVPDRFSSSVKVRPFEEPNDGEEDDSRPAWTAFSPLDETPIQREIRHATEREQSLRQLRGLKTGESGITPGSRRIQEPANDTSERNPNAAFVIANRRKSTPSAGAATTSVISDSGRLSMRNFASARLQLEIEREKQRELDLLRLGCIRTTSNDHIASIASNDETESRRVDKMTQRRAANRSSYVEALSNLIELQQQDGEMVTYRGKSNQLNGSGTTLNGTAKKRWSTAGPLVSVKRKDADVMNSRKHSMTSELIERELRELELREQELRSQRLYSSVSTPNDVIYQDDCNGAMSPTENDVSLQRSNGRSYAFVNESEERTG